jgi:pSer/pThr/pTyr-binding forkhead associated (FHA) protein
MSASPLAPHSSTPTELKIRLEAERDGLPFIVFRDDSGQQHLRQLRAGDGAVDIGRRSACGLSLHWDPGVSRAHAEIQPIGSDWVIVDDGLSQNGTFVNGERITGRRRLHSGDVIRIGKTTLAYWAPPASTAAATTTAGDFLVEAPTLTQAERRVLVALARPLKQPGGVPATNQQIAHELYVSIPTVKTHLRSISEKFGLADVPQTHKRHELIARAFRDGILSEHDL